MKELESNVKAIEMDGLAWGASKLVAVGFGIKKLQINLVVEDEKVSLDDLQGKIEEDDDHVQSTDIVRASLKIAIQLLTILPSRLLCRSCRPLAIRERRRLPEWL